MIGRLTGVLVAQSDDGSALIDVGGVGYEVSVPLGAIGRARKDAEGNLTLHVHTHATRDEAMILYGFATADERHVFRTVLSVPNVGPKTALAILGGLGVSELAAAIARKDLGRLTSISGVGKKTAERLLLELKDKLHALTSNSAVAPATSMASAPKREQLRSALENMGFRPAEVERALDALHDRIDAAELRELLREALGLLR